ncbi:MAG: hypothetical protein JNJ47_07030 [Alphaproteobacteria bacterium]|nr:hypothetical protein [Alphaproteobacteria bacterium]
MLKKLFRTIFAASTISLALLGGTGLAWSMWEELEDIEKRAVMSYHHPVIDTPHCHHPAYDRAWLTTYYSKIKNCSVCVYEIEKINAQKDVQNRLIALEDTVKTTSKSLRVEVLEQQLDAQKNEIQSLLFANKALQHRVQKIELIQDKEEQVILIPANDKIIPIGANDEQTNSFVQQKLLAEEIQQREQERRRKHEETTEKIRIPETSNEQESRNNLIPSIEEKGSLFSTVKSLRQIKLQQDETIKNLHEEVEESTKIIKKMMKIIGIKTDDFSDCTGNIFAKKCLDRLNDEMGSV